MAFGPSVLIIDDEPGIRALLLQALHGWGYEAFAAASLREAREFLQARQVDAIACDGMLEDGLGMDFVNQLRWAHDFTPVLFISGSVRPKSSDDPHLSILPKPFDMAVFRAALEALLRSSERPSLQAIPGQREARSGRP